MELGRVFNVQRFSVHDGPGIRTTVFLKGCPLRCRWCHNPEGMSPAPERMILASRCIHCGRCVEVCPSGIAAEAGAEEVEGSSCILCGTCAEACPAAARQIVGRSMTVGEGAGLPGAGPPVSPPPTLNASRSWRTSSPQRGSNPRSEPERRLVNHPRKRS